jgi:hypothetical protein
MSEDDTATAALLEFLNASEAGIIAAKHLIMEAKGVAEEHSWLWDPSKIKWQQTQGSSGPYEKSEDVNSSDFKQPNGQYDRTNQKKRMMSRASMENGKTQDRNLCHAETTVPTYYVRILYLPSYSNQTSEQINRFR